MGINGEREEDERGEGGSVLIGAEELGVSREAAQGRDSGV